MPTHSRCHYYRASMVLVVSEITAKFTRQQQEQDGGSVIDKIRKMLDRGLHAGTPQQEAERCMRLAQTLMTKYNLDRATVMEETKEPTQERGNLYYISVTTANGKMPQSHAWMRSIAGNVAHAFTCKSFSTMYPHRMCFAFYGMQTSALAAATAFGKYILHIDEKTRSYMPAATNGIALTGADKATWVRTERNNFCNGMVDGLWKAICEEERLEKKRKQKMSLFIDIYDKMISSGPDVDDFITESINVMAADLGLDKSLVESRGIIGKELVAYGTVTDLAKQVENAVLEEANFKLGKSRKRTFSAYDSAAYRAGVLEGKKMKQSV